MYHEDVNVFEMVAFWDIASCSGVEGCDLPTRRRENMKSYIVFETIIDMINLLLLINKSECLFVCMFEINS
jgi:hypothetical protein